MRGPLGCPFTLVLEKKEKGVSGDAVLLDLLALDLVALDLDLDALDLDALDFAGVAVLGLNFKGNWRGNGGGGGRQ